MRLPSSNACRCSSLSTRRTLTRVGTSGLVTSSAASGWDSRAFTTVMPASASSQDRSSSLGRCALRRVCRLLLLTRRVPRLPRLVLGLRLCLQPLLRFSSRRRCGGGHLVTLFHLLNY